MKFNEFKTTSGKLVLAGKNAENNEKLVEQVEDSEIIFHTAKPGSPFVNIKANKTNKLDRKEAAIFCALKSQDWRDDKSNVEVHSFLGKDIYKTRGMKVGCFGIKKIQEKMLIKKKEIESFTF